jgi:hypothetical protein
MSKTPSTPAAGSWVERVAGNVNSKKGWSGAMKDGLSDIGKGFKLEKGYKAVAFGRTIGVGAGLAVAGDALFRSKDEDGNDRGALARLGEGVLGLGIAAGSLAAGRAR